MKKKHLLLSFLVLLTFLSCQDESETSILNSDKSFVKSSPISSLISRVSQYETTADNVLDGTSNFSIKLPVQITVNNQNVSVTSEADFITVQSIKNQSNSDDDKVHFEYPITITLPNHQEYNITSETQFENIVAQYGDDGAYHEIACIDFNYPISINIYNANNQIGSSITVQNDVQLYSFVQNLVEGVVVGIVFPITMTKSNGNSEVVQTNLQLETLINNVISDCSIPSPTPLLFSDILTNGSWHVSYFYDDHDETYNYSGYNFNFNPNGTAIAIKNTTTINGNWQIHNENNYQKIEFNFNGMVLEELEEDWKILEFTATTIRLKHESGSGTENHYLNFTKN